MPTVTYKHQPGIHATRGTVPLAGTRHLYTVKKVLWPEEVTEVLRELVSVGRCLHVCSGHSPLGDVRMDKDPEVSPDVVADADRIPFNDGAFDVVLCDPPYNGRMQWNHDMLKELSRVASKRIVFQHWFMPVNPDGKYKKWTDKWALSDVYVWQPRTYFGRAQLISVFDDVTTAIGPVTATTSDA